MITIRKAEDRGRTRFGWLDSAHTFSFGGYRDPDNMGFRSLRVINDDLIAPGAGFPKHPHKDMEILSFILSGALAHEDSTGGGSVIRPGDVQHMTAGRGILHSEFNPSEDEPTHLLQVWIMPRENGLEPAYGERSFTSEQRSGALRLVASPDGAEDSLGIQADARVLNGVLSAGEEATYAIDGGRGVWVHVATGAVSVNGNLLRAGDGAAIEDEPTLQIEAIEDSEVLVFDLG